MSVIADNRSAAPVPRDWRIETRRLTLTGCDAQADEALARIVAQPRVYEPYYMEPASIRSAVADAESWWAQNAALFNVVARERNGGRIVGVVQFEGNRLAYLVDPELWKRGFGVEMVTACMAQVPALFSLRELHASLLRENRASQRILERAGFRFSGLEQMRWGTGAARAVLNYRWLSYSPCPAPPGSGCAG
jgi:RimJ/RimL family protein N-acetyltransferase